MLEQLLQSTIYMDPKAKIASSIDEEEKIILETPDQEETPKETKKGDKERMTKSSKKKM